MTVESLGYWVFQPDKQDEVCMSGKLHGAHEGGSVTGQENNVKKNK